MSNQIINDLLTSINKVKPFYFTQPQVNLGSTGLIIEEEQKHYERRLMTEIYSEYKQIIKTNPIYADLNPDTEVIKKYIYGSKENEDKEIINAKEYLRTLSNSKNKEFDELKFLTTIPDFFIHKKQSNMTHSNQLLIAELKTDPRMDKIDFFMDVFKLNIYLEKFNFQNAAFIIVNKSKEYIIREVQNYFANTNTYKTNKSSKDLYFVLRPQDGSPFEAFSYTEFFYPNINKE